MMAINLKYLRSVLLMRFSRVVNFFFLGYNIFTSYPANLSASVDPSAKANQRARSSKAQRNARLVLICPQATGQVTVNLVSRSLLSLPHICSYARYRNIVRVPSLVSFDNILPSSTFSSFRWLLNR